MKIRVFMFFGIHTCTLDVLIHLQCQLFCSQNFHRLLVFSLRLLFTLEIRNCLLPGLPSPHTLEFLDNASSSIFIDKHLHLSTRSTKN